jgi:hypothetical protein
MISHRRFIMFSNGFVQTFESSAMGTDRSNRQSIVTSAGLAPLVQKRFCDKPVRLDALPNKLAKPVAGRAPTLTSLTAMPP